MRFDRKISGKGVISGVSRSMEVQSVLLFFWRFSSGCMIGGVLGGTFGGFSKLCLLFGVFLEFTTIGGGFKYMFSRLLESEKHLSVLGLQVAIM